MVIAAFLGRLSRGLRVFPVVLFALTGLEYVTALVFADSGG